MPDLDQIVEVRVVASAEGVNEAVAAAGRLGASLDKLAVSNENVAEADAQVAVVGERTTKYRISAAAAAERLQRQIDAEYRAQKLMESALRDIERARQQGIISATREGELIKLAEQRYGSAAAAMNRAAAANTNHAQTSGIAAHQLQNLGYQLNDVVTSLASGAPAFQVFAQQGGQIVQVLGETGVGAAVRGVGSAIGRFITPATVTVGALTGAAVLGYMAWSRYDDLTRSVSTTLQGLGRQVGLTAADFEKLTATAAASAGLSARQGLSLGQAFAAGGQIGPENIAKLIGVAKDAAATFGVSLDEVKEKLAGAFGSAEGIARLNDQLRFLDARTLSLVQSLFRQGREQEAIALAVDRLPPALAKAETAQGAVARAWEAIKTAASDADAAVGKAIDRIVKGPSPQQRLAELKASVDFERQAAEERLVQPGSVSRSYSPPTSPTVSSTSPLPPERPRELQDSQEQLRRYMETLAETTRKEEETARNRALEEGLVRRSNELKSYMRELAPGSDEYRKMKDNDEAFQSVLRSGNKELIARVGSVRDFNEAASIAQHATKSLTNADGERMTAAERASRQNALDLAGVRARTVEDRASIAARAQVERARGQAIEGAQAEAQAEHAAAMIREEANQRLRDMLRDQQLEAQDIRERIGLIGQDTEARAVAIARRRTESDLTRDGISLNGDLARSVIAGAEANARLGVSYDRAAEAQQRMRDGQRELASEFTGFVTDILAGGQKIGAAFDTLAKSLSSNVLKGLISGEGPFAGILGMAPTEKGRMGGILGGKLDFGGLFSSDKIAESLGLGAESGLGKALSAALKEQKIGGGFFSSNLGQGLAAAGAGASVGYSSQSPLAGAAAGALAGLMTGNPYMAIAGPAIGHGATFGKRRPTTAAPKPETQETTHDGDQRPLAA